MIQWLKDLGRKLRGLYTDAEMAEMDRRADAALRIPPPGCPFCPSCGAALHDKGEGRTVCFHYPECPEMREMLAVSAARRQGAPYRGQP